MRGAMRKLGLVAALLLALVGAAQANMVMRHAGASGGGFDPTRWVEAGEDLRMDGGLETTAAGSVDMIVRLAIVAPQFACVNPRWVFAGFIGKEVATNPETAVGNSFTINGMTVERGDQRGTPTSTIKFTGSSSVSVASGNHHAITDSPGITIPANASATNDANSYYLVVDVQVASAGMFLPQTHPTPLTGEGAVNASASQVAKLTSATSLGSTFPSGGAFAPVDMWCQGADGSDVTLVGGDSLGQGNGDKMDAVRGVLGYSARGLDSLSGGRRSYTNWAVGSTSFGATSEGATTFGNYGGRLSILADGAALNAGGAPTFSVYLADGGTNNASNLATVNPAFWALIRTQFSTVRIGQLTIAPHTDDTIANKTTCGSATAAQNNCWANASQVPDQSAYNYPAGAVTVFNAALNAGSYTGPAGATFSGVAGGYVDFVVDITPYSTAPSSQIWASPAFATTFAQNASIGDSTIHLAACPSVGDALVLGVATANAENGIKDSGGLLVQTATLGADCAVTFKTGGGSTLSKAHTAGDAVGEAISNSGLHPDQMGAIMMSAAIVTAKTSHLIAANDNRVRLVVGPGHWVRRAA